MPPDRQPIVKADESEYTASTSNNPDFARRVGKALQSALGEENVLNVDPVMGGEDFGSFSLEDKIPLCIFWLGAVDPVRVEKSRREGMRLMSDF